MSSIEIPQSAAISEYAIIVDPGDNVAVVKKATFADLEVVLPDEIGPVPINCHAFPSQCLTIVFDPL